MGLGEAARLAAESIAAGEPARIGALRDRLLAGLRGQIEGVEVNGSMERRLPGNLHVSIVRAEAETLILSLGGRIAISSGAACAEAGGKGSHVLRAVGLSDERVYTALRFGIGRFNDAAEIDEAVEDARRGRRYGPKPRDGRATVSKKPITQIACLCLAAVTECKSLQG